MQKKTKPPQIFTVDADGLLQDYLITTLRNESRNKVKALLKFRAVTVNGRVAIKYDHPLKAGDRIEIQSAPDPAAKRRSALPILYEDNEIIVVDKPAGMLSIATESERDRTAYHLLMEYVREDNLQNRIFVVHRLDKDTSGVLVVAKNEQIKLALQDNWADIVKIRGYVALVEGVPAQKSGRIRSWLKETKTHLMYVSHRPGDGLEAITNYEVITNNSEHTLLKIGLETGRKNQIRVQLQDIGHPIVGDKKYGASTNPMRRLCLHADHLELTHPITGKLMHFHAPVPKGFLTLTR